jgi:hypothetical protein
MQMIRFRVLLVVAAATFTGLLALATLLRRDWLEAVFSVNADIRDGSAERAIVVALAAASIGLFCWARFEWGTACRHEASWSGRAHGL